MADTNANTKIIKAKADNKGQNLGNISTDLNGIKINISGIKNLDVNDMLERFWESTVPARELMSYYNCAIMEVETKFRVLSEQFSLAYDHNPIESITSRLKSPYSIWQKLQKIGVSMEMDVDEIEKKINDVAGVRVICSFEDDIYMLRDCLVSQDDITLIREKDYIKNPKPNGYRSLHLIVEVPIFLKSEKRLMKVEIQLRTIAMDSWASLEHKIRYKKNLSQETQEKISVQLNQCAEISAQLDEIMLSIKRTVEHDEDKDWLSSI